MKDWPLCADCCERVYNPEVTKGSCNWCLRKSTEGWADVYDYLRYPEDIKLPYMHKDDSGNTPCWVVKYKKTYKLFKQSDYGSPQLTMRAAIKFRDSIVPKEEVEYRHKLATRKPIPIKYVSRGVVESEGRTYQLPARVSLEKRPGTDEYIRLRVTLPDKKVLTVPLYNDKSLEQSIAEATNARDSYQSSINNAIITGNGKVRKM